MRAHQLLFIVLLSWALTALAAPVPGGGGKSPKVSYKPYGQDNISDAQKKEIDRAVKGHTKKTDPLLTGYHATAPFHISATDGTPHITGYAKTGSKGSAKYEPQGERQTHLYLADGQQWRQPDNVGKYPGKTWTGSSDTQKWSPAQGRYQGRRRRRSPSTLRNGRSPKSVAAFRRQNADS